MKKIFSLFVLFISIISNVAAQANFIQNIKARNIYNLDGRWHYIVDPYKTGEGSKFYLNKKQQSKSDLIEYNFDAAYTLAVPGDWNSQNEKLLYYEGVVGMSMTFIFNQKQEKDIFSISVQSITKRMFISMEKNWENILVVLHHFNLK